MNFGLPEEIEEMRDVIARWVADRLEPRADEIDTRNEFPRDLWPELGELGLLGITADEEYGGSGLGYLAHCVATEEISRGSGAVGLSYLHLLRKRSSRGGNLIQVILLKFLPVFLLY